MKLEIQMENREFSCELSLSEQQLMTMEPLDKTADSWENLTSYALNNPFGVNRPADEDLKGKKIVIIVDDWGRPTPAYKFIPLIIEEVKKAGAVDENISFITASGMHDPMSQADLERKLGKDIVAKYNCVSHDGGDVESLSFCGITDQGTPIWVNTLVAEADYKIACGRVHPHVAYGYEGGYKMILPGVASFETIVRDHAFNFSPISTYGVLEGPSRKEADAVGKMVGIDFLINYTVNKEAEPVAAFGGQVELVHRKAVAYGDKNVWGVALGELKDVTIAVSPAESDGVDSYVVNMAATATKPGGTVIVLVNPEKKPPKDSDFHDLTLSEVLRLHEKRNYTLERRDIQWRLKAIRGEELRRRLYFNSGKKFVFVGGELSDKTLALTNSDYCKTLQEAVDRFVPKSPETKALLLPKPWKTLPLKTFHEA